MILLVKHIKEVFNMNMKKAIYLILSLIILVSIIFTGCGNSGNTNDIDNSNGSVDNADTSKEDGGLTDTPDDSGKDSGETGSDYMDSDVSTEPDSTSDEYMMDESGKSTPSNGNQGSQTINPSPGMLTAGEWNDNIHYDFFEKLMNDNIWQQTKSLWNILNMERYVVDITFNDNTSAKNVTVILEDKSGNIVFTGRTDNNGRIYIYPNLDKVFIKMPEYNIRIKVNDYSELFDFTKMTENSNMVSIKLDTQSFNPDRAVDIMFVVDTTGSMADELEFIKVELEDIIKRVKNENDNILLRLSANFYRDVEDEYVVKSFPFTGNVNEVTDIISKQSAKGGGDFPEAVERALDDAINNHTWNENASARIMFLVLDAPPHYTQNNINTIHSLMKDANEKGITIIPVASSGIDKETEFFLRILSLTTNGTYVFLTNHSGIGNDHIEPTIGDYEVEFLNDLIVRLINDRIK